MAPSVVGHGTVDTSATASVAVNIPTSVAGDVLLAVVQERIASTPTHTCSGWTQIGTTQRVGYTAQSLWYKISAGTNGSTTQTIAVTGANRSERVIIALRGVIGDALDSGSDLTLRSCATTGTTVTVPAITPATAGALVLAIHGHGHATSSADTYNYASGNICTVNTNVGALQAGSSTTRIAGTVYYGIGGAAGVSTGNQVFTYSSSSSITSTYPAAGCLIAFKAAVTIEKAATLDAQVALPPVEKTATVAGLVAGTDDNAATLDALIARTVTPSTAPPASVSVPSTGTAGQDFVVTCSAPSSLIQAQTVVLDAFVASGAGTVARTATLSALTGATVPHAITLDAAVAVGGTTKSATVSAAVAATLAPIATVGALVGTALAKNAVVDAYVASTATKTSTTGALVASTPVPSSTASALVAGTVTGSATLSALIRGTVTKTATLDTLTSAPSALTREASATLGTAVAGTLTPIATLIAVVAGTVTKTATTGTLAAGTTEKTATATAAVAGTIAKASTLTALVRGTVEHGATAGVLIASTVGGVTAAPTGVSVPSTGTAGSNFTVTATAPGTPARASVLDVLTSTSGTVQRFATVSVLVKGTLERSATLDVLAVGITAVTKSATISTVVGRTVGDATPAPTGVFAPTTGTVGQNFVVTVTAPGLLATSSTLDTLVSNRVTTERSATLDAYVWGLHAVDRVATASAAVAATAGKASTVDALVIAPTTLVRIFVDGVLVSTTPASGVNFQAPIPLAYGTHSIRASAQAPGDTESVLSDPIIITIVDEEEGDEMPTHTLPTRTIYSLATNSAIRVDPSPADPKRYKINLENLVATGVTDPLGASGLRVWYAHTQAACVVGQCKCIEADYGERDIFMDANMQLWVVRGGSTTFALAMEEHCSA